MKEQVIYNIGGSITAKIFDHDIQVVPDDYPKVTIYSPDGDKIITEADATVATDGTLSYAVSAADADTLGIDYRALWKYEINTVVFYKTTYFDVVIKKLTSIISDRDLVDECSKLQEYGYRITGIAEDLNSKSQIQDTANLLLYRDNYFKGGRIEIIDGTNVGQKRIVTASAQATGKIMVQDDFDTECDSTTKYVLTKSYQHEIDQAFESIMDDLEQKGFRPALLLDDRQLRRVHILLTLAFIFKGMVKEVNDTFWAFYQDYFAQYKRKFSELKLNFDMDLDGDGIKYPGNQVGVNVIDLER